MSVIVTEMTFYRCEHPFLIKSMKKVGVEEADISIIKVVYSNL